MAITGDMAISILVANVKAKDFAPEECLLLSRKLTAHNMHSRHLHN
jgi:hypothetical protein